jgi:hypothetical protein
MNTALLKIILMPLIIAAVTLIARKWGNVIGGVVAGMPWVGGAILFFISVEQGETFMINALPGVLIGLIGWLGFCTTYMIAGQRFAKQRLGVLLSFIVGIFVYLLIGFSLQDFTNTLPINGWFVVMVLLAITSLSFFPKVKRQNEVTPKSVKFEIPLRMTMITAFVFGVTYFAEMMGPNWSGILTPFPVMTATLAIFTHYTQGLPQVRLALMGMYTGVIGFSIFLISVAYFTPQYGLVNSFLLGLFLNVVATLSTKQVFSKLNLI